MVDFRAKRCLAKLLFRAVFETVTGIVFAPVKHHLRLWKRGKRFSNETRCLNTEFNR